MINARAKVIPVAPEDYIDTHRSVVHLLQIVAPTGFTGISTAKLCDLAFDSHKRYADNKKG